jgi:hypothetical protein
MANEQNASQKRYCHPSRELFRAGDLLFFRFIVRQKKADPPLRCWTLRMTSGIAAERDSITTTAPGARYTVVALGPRARAKGANVC